MRSSRRVLAGVAALLLASCVGPVARAAEEKAFTLSGASVLLPDGTLKPDTALVVSGERILRLAEAKEKNLPGVIRFPAGAVISPGLIDLGSTLGAHGQNTETARAIDPDAHALAAVDPFHRDLCVARAAGVTAALICPASTSLVSGTAVVVRTGPHAGGTDVLRRDGPLTFSLASSALRTDRAPTSRPGAMVALKAALAAARGKTGNQRLRAFLEGKAQGIVFCDTSQDLRLAFELFAELDRMPAIVHNVSSPLPDARDFARQAKERGAHVVLGPFAFQSSEARLRSAATLSEAGVPVAFRGGLPAASRHSARLTAALAVRYGMDPAAARRAFTVEAARVAGVAKRVGSLAAGKDADLVVFSGDPLRLDSRVLEVYVRGERVHPRKTGGR